MFNERFFKMKIVCIISLILTVVKFVKSQENGGNFYSRRYDNLNIDTILASPRLVTNYVDCLLNRKPCPPEGKDLKRILPEALRTKCSRCTIIQKENALKVITKLYKDYPQYYRALSDKWDPNGEYNRRFEEYLRNEQFNAIPGSRVGNRNSIPADFANDQSQINPQSVPVVNRIPSDFRPSREPQQPQPPPVIVQQQTTKAPIVQRTTRQTTVTQWPSTNPPPPPPTTTQTPRTTTTQRPTIPETTTSAHIITTNLPSVEQFPHISNRFGDDLDYEDSKTEEIQTTVETTTTFANLDEIESNEAFYELGQPVTQVNPPLSTSEFESQTVSNSPSSPDNLVTVKISINNQQIPLSPEPNNNNHHENSNSNTWNINLSHYNPPPNVRNDEKPIQVSPEINPNTEIRSDHVTMLANGPNSIGIPMRQPSLPPPLVNYGPPSNFEPQRPQVVVQKPLQPTVIIIRRPPGPPIPPKTQLIDKFFVPPAQHPIASIFNSIGNKITNTAETIAGMVRTTVNIIVGGRQT